MKKILGLLTAAIMSVSVLSVPAFAEAGALLSQQSLALPASESDEDYELSSRHASGGFPALPANYYIKELPVSYQLKYEELRTAVRNFEPTFVINNYRRTKEETDFVFKAMDVLVNYDSYTHNVSDIQALISGTRLTFEITYDVEKDVYGEGIAAADEAYAELAKTFKETDNTATKVKKIHDYIASITEYSIEAPESDNIYGVFKNGLAKCDGYARAFNFLAEKAGIETVMSVGLPVIKTDDTGHAWNKVKIGNSWYVVDVTNNDRDDSLGFITYDYFMVSDSEYGKSFEEIDDQYITEPIANNSKNSYYSQKKLIAETAEDALALIKSQAGKAKSAPFIVSVQLTSDAEFTRLVNALKADSTLFSGAVKINKQSLVSYTTGNKVTRTLHIVVRVDE
jgi:hypothetical protein